MLSGRLVNCYGIKQFDLPAIDFTRCNKALIYAPNGVMKSSFTKVFEDIAQGKPTSDRIFQGVTTSYAITHYASQYQFSSANPRVLPTPTDKIYVVNSFADKFEFTKAIIEYLNDLAQNTSIDLLMLTHNFDFYRTVKLRLGVDRPNCFIAQKNADGIIKMTVFRYQKDFFKNVIITEIKNGHIDSDVKKKLLIASIPFYRNLCEYSGKDNDYLKLTCFLHLKTTPIDTETIMLSDLWSIISSYLDDNTFSGIDEGYYSSIQRIASDTIATDTDEVSLENKLLVSIATRLAAEKYLKRKLIENGQPCSDSHSNQTRDWFDLARPYLSIEEQGVIEEVNLITPENIHLNAFMFEPLIDISDWALKELYQKVIAL